MPILSRDAILAVDDRPTELVEVPEWGGEVLVRGLSGEDRDAWESSLTVTLPKIGKPQEKEVVQDLSNVHAKLVSRAIVDEQGNRMFTDADVSTLGQKSALALHRVFEVASRLSGLDADAAADAEGNSDDAPSGDSTSDSAATSEA